MIFGADAFAAAPFATSIGYGASESQLRGIRAGFDVDFEPKLWWQRKPKRITEEEASEALAKAAKVIKQTAREQVAEAIPEAQRKGQARKAIEPVALQMPGFDWRPMYEAAYSEALTAAIMAQMQQTDAKRKALAERRRRDEETVLLMLL